MCCDISAVNSLSVLERKTKININCSVLHKTAVFYINCRLFRLFHIKWTSKKTLSNDMHSQKTVLHINCRLSCLRLTSTAVFHKTAVLHINCRLFVCLFKFGWNKAHAKNANKVVPCRFENNMQKRANIPKPTVTNLENISSIPVPLLNCALSGDRTCQKKTSVSFVLHEFLWKFMPWLFVWKVMLLGAQLSRLPRFP